jgi:hypothetical protein
MARKKGKRPFDPINLSFLDVISCGFGAVVLIFLILDHSSSTATENSNPLSSAEIALLNEDIQQGELGLVRLRNTLSDVDLRMVEAQGLARQIQEQITTIMEELAERENETMAEEDSVEKLQADIASLEEELRRLKDQEAQLQGNNARQFIGEGNRQYLTGMILGGNRILIMLDISASMLDSTIVNIIRRRNLPIEARLNSEKWVQVRRIVDWLTAQLPPPSQYQLLVFNNQTRALLPGTEGSWLEVADEAQLSSAVNLLNQTVPAQGTNLEQAFAAIKTLNPPPDNIYLITDGLPTLGSRGNNSGNISGRDREELFERAIRELPARIPVNVIMAPLEGDPMAAALYWQLTVKTGGSFLSPASDWP